MPEEVEKSVAAFVMAKKEAAAAKQAKNAKNNAVTASKGGGGKGGGAAGGKGGGAAGGKVPDKQAQLQELWEKSKHKEVRQIGDRWLAMATHVCVCVCGRGFPHFTCVPS